MAADSVVVVPAARLAMNRAQQRNLYGDSLRSIVGRVLEAYGISQARLAATLGVSPAALSLLVSARRVRLRDPLAYTRLMLLDQSRDRHHGRSEVLAGVARLRRPWPHHNHGQASWNHGVSVERHRYAASHRELTEAAARIRDEFPAAAALLRRHAENGVDAAATDRTSAVGR